MVKKVLALVVFAGANLMPCAYAAKKIEFYVDVPADISRSPNLKLKIVVPKSYRSMTAELHELSLESLRIASQALQLKLRDNVSIYFDPASLDHNGLTTVVPRNRILIYPELPESDSSIAFSQDYLRETMVHEFGHMLMMQQRGGFFNFFSYLVGTASRPIGLWPRWIHEGLAVWTEGNVGGRPASGAIARDLRLYQEKARRSPKFKLESDDLNGDLESASIPGGRLPYSFGYLIGKDILEKIPPQTFVGESSYSLGMSFRPTLRSLDYDLDSAFEKIQQRWREEGKTAPPSAPWKEISHAKRIKGPFQFEQEVSWLESGGSEFKKQQLVFLHPILGPQKSPAPKTLGSIESAYRLKSGEWLLLSRIHPDMVHGFFYNPNRAPIRTLGIWRPGDSSFRCTFKVSKRIRELALDSDRILWVQSTPKGKNRLYQAHWNESCNLVGREMLAESRMPFERIDTPHLAFSGKGFWSQSQGRNLSAESLQSEEGWLIRAPHPLTNPALATRNMLVAIESRPESWGPTLINLPAKKKMTVPVETSIRRLVFARDHIIGVKEYWDKEELVTLSLKDALESALQTENVDVSLKEEVPLSKPAALVASTKIKTESYSPLSESIPSFWSPIAGADGSGYYIAGSTFFSDLSGRYTGSLAGGYSSLTEKGFATSLFRFNSKAGFPWPSPTLHFSNSPRFLTASDPYEQRSQNYYRAGLSVSYPAQWQRSLFSNLGLGISYENQEQTYYFDGGSFWIPSLSLSLRNRSGRPPDRSPNSLVDSDFSFFTNLRVRRIEELEAQASISVEHKLWRRAGSRWQIEGGFTDLRNYPFSYFIFGGNALINTQDATGYLSRGYPYRFGIAQGVVRAAHESDFRLINHEVSLGWSRAKINNLDLRLIAETLTWDGVRTSTHLFDRYFHTLGAELRTAGKILGYVGYEASLGYYAGISEPRNHEIAISLRTWLDL